MPKSTLAVLCFLFLSVGMLRGQESENGLNMFFHRNFYSGSLNHLEQMHDDRETPFRTLALTDFQTRSPWNINCIENLGRLYALVIQGWLMPDTDGEYVFSAHCNGTMRLYLSTGDKEADCRRIELEKLQKVGPAEPEAKKKKNGPVKPSEYIYAPNLIASESVELKAGTPYFVKVFFIPGWKDSLAVGWNLKDKPDTLCVIPGKNLKKSIQ